MASGNRAGLHVQIDTSPHSPRRSILPSSSPPPRGSPTSLQSAMSESSPNEIPSSSDSVRGSPTILRGIIVGQEQTGKTTLIRRLRGEDPFQSKLQTNRTHREGRENRHLMALVPWKLPTDVVSSASLNGSAEKATIEQDGVVQLYASEAKSFSTASADKSYNSEEFSASFRKEWMAVMQNQKKKQRGKDVDYAVWLIDPRMDGLLEYVSAGLEVLFPRKEENDTGGKEGDASKEFIGAATQPPKHLCILLNFRDLDNRLDGELDKVRQLVNDTLATADASTSQLQPTVLVYESSLQNCYGLQQLHSFITLPYLSHQEAEYRRRAEEARTHHIATKQMLTKWDVVQYSEFINTRERDNVVVSPPKHTEERKQQFDQMDDRQRLRLEKEKLERRLREQKRVLESNLESSNATHRSTPKETKVSDSAKAENPDVATHSAPRKLFSTSQPPQPQKGTSWTPLDNVTNNNLDSFFSDDEDEDEEENTTAKIGDAKEEHQQKQQSKSKVLDRDESSSDSSDGENSDDDFFIDTTGHRRAHVTMKAVTSSTVTNSCYKERTEEHSADEVNAVFSKEEEGTTTKQDIIDRPVCGDEAAKVSPQVPVSTQIELRGDEADATTQADDSFTDEPDEVAATSDDGKSAQASAEGADTDDTPASLLQEKGVDSLVETKESNGSKYPNTAEESPESKHTEVGNNGEQPLTQNELNHQTDSPDNSTDITLDEARCQTTESANEAQTVEEPDRGKPDDEACVAEKEGVSDAAQTQSQLILDSDDEDDCGTAQVPIPVERTHIDDSSDEEFTIDIPKTASFAPTNQAKPDPSPKVIDNTKTVAVSSAALAAIQAARKEAEQIMSQAGTTNAPKKSKKDKKKSKSSKKSSDEDTEAKLRKKKKREQKKKVTEE